MSINPHISRLLIVEDDSDIRALLIHFLKQYVDVIIEASDGAEALVHIKNTSFDAILSDIEMPHINGLKLLAYVRTLGLMTPFIVLTAHGDHSKALEALSLGAFDFITKDVKKQFMIESVIKALKFGKEVNESKNDSVKVSTLKKVYSDMSKDSEVRLLKIIDELNS